MKIRWKIVLVSSLSLITAIAVTQAVNMNLFSSTQSQVQEATEELLYKELSGRLLSVGQSEGRRVSGQINRAMLSARSFGAAINSLRDEAAEKNLSRRALRARIVRTLGGVLEKETDFLGSYTAFEPNALDNADNLQVGQQGSDDNGRFAPYVYRTAESAANLDILLGLENQERDANGVRAGEYYLCPKETQQDCLIDPYIYPVDGEDVLLTSLVTPIIEDGKFLGIAGVDLSVSFIQSIAEEVSRSLYGGDSIVVIASHVGIVAGHSAQPGALGKRIDNLLHSGSNEVLGAMQQHLEAFIKTDERLVAVVPFNIGDINKSWTISISVPTAKATAALVALNNTLAEKKSDAWIYSTVLTLICILIAVGVITFVAGRIVSSINEMSVIIREIAQGEGDLSRRVDIKTDDEIGVMAGYVNSFIDTIHQLVGRISTQTIGITQDSEASQAETSKNTSRMSDQQAEIESIVLAVNKLNESSVDVAQSATRAAKSATDANAAVKEGSQVVEYTVDAINVMAEDLHEAVAVIKGLEASSGSISDILTVIKEIARQTNLLALNATVEAARAGEHGKGFAVVADEVRNLSQRSREAADEIQEMISELTANTSRAVQVMSSSTTNAEACVNKASKTTEVLDRILDSVSQINDMNAQIAGAADQQSSVSNNINNSVSSINDLSKSVYSSAESISQLGQRVSNQSSELSELVGQFKL
jgi:methyl-accepting chemotaxis protein